MRRLLALLAALAVIAGGCGEDDSEPSNAAPEATRQQATSDASTVESEPSSSDEAGVAKRAREALDLYYPPSKDFVKKVTASGGDVTVETSLFRDSDADAPATGMCTALYGPGVDSPKGVTGARILGTDGGVIKRC